MRQAATIVLRVGGHLLCPTAPSPLQALDFPEQLSGILVKLHEVHRFTVASAFPLHHHLLLAWDAAVRWQV